MAERDSNQSRPRLTARGAATRARILDAAAELMYVQGVSATSLERILSASTASKSQFYQYFTDKADLVLAVIALRADQILTLQRLRLEKLDSFRGLEQWRDAIVQRSRLRRGAWGCELGSLAAELADTDDVARTRLAEHFAEWEQLLTDGFGRMRDSGVLRDDIAPARLAIGVIAALQGGYLLAQTSHGPERLAVALDMAIAHVKSFQAPGATV